jgi:hypothetical protein
LKQEEFMRHVISVAIGVALSTAVTSPIVWAQNETPAHETPVPTTNSTPPTMTAVEPVNPVSSKPGGPILQSITAQIPTRGALTGNMIVPEFHFIAPNGNAVLIHRELVATSANNLHVNPSAAINIPADAQKQGAVFSGGWTCNNASYYATMRAWIMDADGNRSNEVQYTVHCNGG